MRCKENVYKEKEGGWSRWGGGGVSCALGGTVKWGGEWSSRGVKEVRSNNSHSRQCIQFNYYRIPIRFKWQ